MNTIKYFITLFSIFLIFETQGMNFQRGLAFPKARKLYPMLNKIAYGVPLLQTSLAIQIRAERLKEANKIDQIKRERFFSTLKSLFLKQVDGFLLNIPSDAAFIKNFVKGECKQDSGGQIIKNRLFLNLEDTDVLSQETFQALFEQKKQLGLDLIIAVVELDSETKKDEQSKVPLASGVKMPQYRIYEAIGLNNFLFQENYNQNKSTNPNLTYTDIVQRVPIKAIEYYIIEELNDKKNAKFLTSDTTLFGDRYSGVEFFYTFFKAQENDVVAQNSLGIYYRKKQQRDAAIKWFTQAALKNCPEAQYELGVLLVDSDNKKAEEWLLKAKENFAHAVNAQKALSRIYKARGAIRQANNWSQASKNSEAKYNGFLQGMYYLATDLALAKKYILAIEDFPERWFHLGFIDYTLKDYSLALPNFKEALRNTIRVPETKNYLLLIYLELANINRANGEYELAKEKYFSAIKLGYPQVTVNLGIAYYENKEFDLAKETLLPLAHDNNGLAQYFMGIILTDEALINYSKDTIEKAEDWLQRCLCWQLPDSLRVVASEKLTILENLQSNWMVFNFMSNACLSNNQ